MSGECLYGWKLSRMCMDVRRVFENNLHSVGYLKGILVMFLEFLEDVRRIFGRCLKDVSTIFREHSAVLKGIGYLSQICLEYLF